MAADLPDELGREREAAVAGKPVGQRPLGRGGSHDRQRLSAKKTKKFTEWPGVSVSVLDAGGERRGIKTRGRRGRK